jgi:hypothetical protein
VFSLLHNAIANEIYHQDMLARRTSEDRCVRLEGGFLLILGLAVSFVPAFGSESPKGRRMRDWLLFVASVALSLFGVVVLVADTGSMAAEHRVLKVQWGSVKADLAELRSHLLEMKSGQPITPEITAQVDAARRRENALVQCETDGVDKDLTDRIWGDANEILYGKDIRTKKQIKETFEKAEKAGETPYRVPKGKAT